MQWATQLIYAQSASVHTKKSRVKSCLTLTYQALSDDSLPEVQY